MSNTHETTDISNNVLVQPSTELLFHCYRITRKQRLMTAHASETEQEPIALHGQHYWPSKQLTAAWLQEKLHEIDMVHSCSGVPDHTSDVLGFFSLPAG
jgi:hypothetical protein